MSKQVGRISGNVLKDNLETNRDKQNFKNTNSDTAVLHLANDLQRIGINMENPARDLETPSYHKSSGLNADRTELPIFTIDNNITANVGSIYLNATDKIQLSSLSVDGIKIDNNTFYSNNENENINLIPSGTGTVEVQKSMNVYGNINATGNIFHGGNLIFGDGPQTPDLVEFATTVNSDLIPEGDSASYHLGSKEKKWANLYSNYLNGYAITAGELSISTTQPSLRPGNLLFVSVNGNDNNVGDHPQGPFATIKRALEFADSSTDGPVTIRVLPGVYQEELPLIMPPNTVIKGTDIRNTIITPDTSSQSEDVFLLDGQCGVENVTIKDFYYDSINDTGYAFRYATGAVITERSPYIRNVTVITSGSNSTQSDPRDFASGDAGKGALIDGSVVDSASLSVSMLFHGATFITPGVDAITMTNGVRVEWLNSFTYFANRGMYATQGLLGHTMPDTSVRYGAELRSIGSANVYGNYGAVADGADTLMYLINHNFAYIGVGGSKENDATKVIEEQQVQELNNGRVYYQNTDELGKFKVGNDFFVDLETGITSIDASNVDFDGLSEIRISDGEGNETFINNRSVDTGNIRFAGNTAFSLSGDLNLDSVTSTTIFNSNTKFEKDLTIIGNLDIAGELIQFGDRPTDTVDFNVKIDQNFVPEKTSTWRLGSPQKLWERTFLSQAQIDDVKIQDNFITTTDSNSNLELLSNSAGVVSLENTTFKNNTISTYERDLEFNLVGDIFNLNSNDSFVLPKGNSLERGNTKGDLRFHSVDNIFEGYGDGVISFRGVYSDDRRTSVTAHKDNNTLNFKVNNINVGQVNSGGLELHGLQSDSILINNNLITTVDSNADLEIRRNGTGTVKLNDQEYFRNNIWTNANNAGALSLNSTDDGYVKISSTGAAYLTAIGTFVEENFDSLPLGQSLTGALVWDTATGGAEVVASGTGTGQFGGFDSTSEGSTQYFKFTGTDTRSLVSKVYDLSNMIGGRIAGKIIAGNDFNGGEIPSGDQDILLEYTTDAGANWNTIAEIAGARNFSAFSIWTDFEIFITENINSPTTQFRIVQRNSNGGNLDTWGLINLQLRYSTEDLTSNPATGAIRYNIGLKQTEAYNGTEWIPSTGIEEDPVTEEFMNNLITEWSLILG